MFRNISSQKVNRGPTCYTTCRMHASLIVKFKKVHPDAVAPEYKTVGAAGFDLAIVEDVVIPPRTFVKARTGLVVQIPAGYFLMIASRGSNPGKKGIALANSIGVLDADFCGPTDEMMLFLENITDTEVRLAKGDRVAQGVVLPAPQAAIEEITGDITDADRGGFGSTG